MLQTTANITACDKHIQIVTNLYKYWQTYTNCDKHIQIVTNTKKDKKQKKNNGDIEVLADARWALKNPAFIEYFKYSSIWGQS
jgi:sulfur relay (sulfurtransferase) DsrC/TusE family protein